MKTAYDICGFIILQLLDKGSKETATRRLEVVKGVIQDTVYILADNVLRCMRCCIIQILS